MRRTNSGSANGHLAECGPSSARLFPARFRGRVPVAEAATRVGHCRSTPERPQIRLQVVRLAQQFVFRQCRLQGIRFLDGLCTVAAPRQVMRILRQQMTSTISYILALLGGQFAITFAPQLTQLAIHNLHDGKLVEGAFDLP